MNGPFDLSREPIHLGKDANQRDTAEPVSDFQFSQSGFTSYIENYCQIEPGHLIMQETSKKDWEYWECHPAGFELVIILRGSGEFVQEIDGKEERLPFKAGDTIVNPPSVWHTADISEPVTAIYITPCPGTRHKPR